MERSTFRCRPSRKNATRVVASALVVAIVFYDGTALAINAIVSQDLPILTEIAMTELASYSELGAILSEAAAITAQVKEYTTVAKAAWGSINDLRTMTFKDLRDGVVTGMGNAFPEVAQIYGDAQDIADLNYSDPRALVVIRGYLWANVYGPGIDYLHSGHDNMEALAEMDDHRVRNKGKVVATREQIEQWQEDCERIAQDEGAQGACQAAANRAAIKSALALEDLQETALYQLDATERLVENEDRKELDRLYEYDRFAFDMRNYLLSVSGDEECRAGECLYAQYGEVMAREVAKYRAKHPTRQAPPVIWALGENTGGEP